MADKKGGMLQPTPFNETTGGLGPQDFDVSGKGELYGAWDDLLSNHLSLAQGDMITTPNLSSGKGIMGGPASGENQAASPAFSTTCESESSKK